MLRALGLVIFSSLLPYLTLFGKASQVVKHFIFLVIIFYKSVLYTPYILQYVRWVNMRKEDILQDISNIEQQKKKKKPAPCVLEHTP